MTVAAPDPPKTDAQTTKRARAKVSPFLRALARIWWSLAAAAGGSLLVGILLVPIGSTPGNYGQGVQNQLGGLLDFYSSDTPVAILVSIAVAAFTAFGFFESRHIKTLDRLAAAQAAKDLAAAQQAAENAQQRAGAAEQAAASAHERVGAVEQTAAATADEVRQLKATLTAAPAPNVAAPGGLPRPLSLVGREPELAKLTASLKGGASTGVFAVEGMGGVGKSALAAEAVARLSEDRDAFPGGAAWISCEGLEGAEGLAELWSRVARALSLELTQADPEARRVALAQSLATRPRTLLALDNVEPGLDADALLDTLAVAGHTALLLTARDAVAPERLTALALAPLPDPDAAILFAQRLRQADEARPTRDDEAHIPELVEAVGGLPLAIELTAAYAGVQQLPLAAVKAELDADGLNAAAYRTNPKKAPLIRFDRSWRVLTPAQQRLFAGLSLLAGASFPRTAALALAKAAGAGDDERPEPDAQGDLAALVTFALVEALPGGDRQRLHPLLREYAELQLTRLPAEVADRLGDAMVAYWLAYAQAHEYRAGRDIANMDALEAEAPGIWGALEWAHDARTPSRSQSTLPKLSHITWEHPRSA